MDYIQLLGIIAGTCTTIAFVPQVIKTYKTRSAKDLSTGMFLIFWTGVVLWLIYGLAVNDLPIIIANVMTLVLATLLLFLKYRYRNQ